MERELSADYMDDVAKQIDRALGRDPIALFAVDRGGMKVGYPLQEALSKYGIDSEVFVLWQEDGRRERYRPVTGFKRYPARRRSPKQVASEFGPLDERFKRIVVADDDIHHGGSVVGAMFYVLGCAGKLGIAKRGDFQGVYLAVDVDRCTPDPESRPDDVYNAAHFAKNREGRSQIAIMDLMDELGPITFERLRDNYKPPRIELIGSYPSPDTEFVVRDHAFPLPPDDAEDDTSLMSSSVHQERRIRNFLRYLGGSRRRGAQRRI